MIDPTQLPILLKAIDFVFDEGRKILEERRERRRAVDAPQDTQEPAKEITPPEAEEVQDIKRDLLASKIEEKMWQDHQKEIEHLVRLLEKHTNNYYTLKEQHAEWGSSLAPPYNLRQMKEKENSIIETRRQLEIVLSKVYQKDIHLNG